MKCEICKKEIKENEEWRCWNGISMHKNCLKDYRSVWTVGVEQASNNQKGK